MGKAKVTVRDVAREAGLSVASVSRVLSGSRPTRPDVSQQVIAAAERLDYRPDPLARSLSTGRTMTIGVVVPDIESPFFPALAGAVERSLRAAGLTMLLVGAENDPSWEATCIRDLLDRRIDGLLISPTHRTRSRHAVEEAARRVPVVQIDRYASGSVDRVVTDARETIRLAVEHLRSEGCTRFAFIGAKSDASVAVDRQRAYQELMQRVDPDGVGRLELGAFTFDWGRAAILSLTAQGHLVDGVVCANDLIALGAIQGLGDAGLDVPAQVAVTGCDDTFFSQVSQPSVTSIFQPVDEIARHAMDLLNRRRSDGEARKVEVQPVLRIRGSTARSFDLASEQTSMAPSE